MREGFMFENASAALAFFKACAVAGAKTREEKMAVIRRMVKKKKAKYIRDAEALLKDKNVLDLTEDNLNE